MNFSQQNTEKKFYVGWNSSGLWELLFYLVSKVINFNTVLTLILYSFFLVIAWAIIPLDFKYIQGKFFFGSWNLFVAVCALPSILIGLWLFFFPESPKFLIECGESEAALDVLKDIFQSNTGRDRSEYPVSPIFFYPS